MVSPHNNDCQSPVMGGHQAEDRVHPESKCGVSSGVSAGRIDVVTGKWVDLWEAVFSDANLFAAVERVQRNKGAAGVDGMSVEQLTTFMAVDFPRVRAALNAGAYIPLPVREVMIPKPGGGQRMLGVPSVVDRVIQQALAQVLTPIFDEGFVPVSYGFRPRKSAHDAVGVAHMLANQGYVWVVKVDLSKYFDTVNHDMLMARVARKVDDKRVLKLIRAYLNAGIMADGVVRPTREGTPQGSPLSPLLSNIMLDDYDQWMWSKGTRFVRYADDIRVFVKSKRAAERGLAQSAKFLEEKLKLRVNRDKSSIAHAGTAELLGYAFYPKEVGATVFV